MSNENTQMNKNSIGEASATEKSASFVQRLLDNWIPVSVFTVVMLSILVVTDYIDYSFPPWLIDILIAYAFMFIPVWLIASRIVTWLVTDDRLVVAEIDAEKDWQLRIYLVSPEAWKDKDVIEGQAYQTQDGIWIVRSIEQTKSGISIKGPWMGEKTDTALATAQKEIRANRGQLRQWAQIGQSLYSGFPAIVQSVTASVWRKHSDDIMVAEEGEDMANIVQNEVVQDAQRLVDSIETPDMESSNDSQNATEGSQEAGDDQ